MDEENNTVEEKGNLIPDDTNKQSSETKETAHDLPNKDEILESTYTTTSAIIKDQYSTYYPTKEEVVDTLPENRKKCIIIGAGYCRTGTTSLKKALEILGYDPCFHMFEVAFGNKKIVEAFEKKFGDKDDGSLKEIFELLETYKATTDHPMCLFWEEILNEFPNSKVILTVRSDESWYKSVIDTVLVNNLNKVSFGQKVLHFFYSHFSRVSNMCKNMFNRNFNSDFSKENLMKVYNQHNKNVEEKCPKEKLLKFEVKDGWKPLCDFLQKKIPKVDFPNENEQAVFQKRFRIFNIVGIFLFVSSCLLSASGAYFIYKKFSKRFR